MMRVLIVCLVSGACAQIVLRTEVCSWRRTKSIRSKRATVVLRGITGVSSSRLGIGSFAIGWLVLARAIVGVYWLYFGVQKWFDYGWVRDTLTIAAQNNPIPVYSNLLRSFILPNWQSIAILQTIAETLIGLGLILGISSRLCGSVGVFMAANLTLAMGFSFPDFSLVFWYYALSLVLNLTALLSDTGRIFGLDRLILKRFRAGRILSLII